MELVTHWTSSHSHVKDGCSICIVLAKLSMLVGATDGSTVPGSEAG